MNNSFHSDNFIFLINAASQVLTLSNIPAQSPSASPPPPVPKGSSKGLNLTDFLRSSDRECLPDNHEIYRKLIKKVNFIDCLPFPAGWDGTVVERVPVLCLPVEIRFSGRERKQPGGMYCVRTVGAASALRARLLRSYVPLRRDRVKTCALTIHTSRRILC